MSSTAAEPLLVASNLGYRFSDRWAVSGVNIRLSSGQALLVTGDNGAGKTTLLRMLASLLRPSTGSFTVAGVDGLTSPLLVRRHVSMLSHSSGLYMALSALDNMRVTARLQGISLSSEELYRHLDRVGLKGRDKEPVRGFSAGMRKRLAWAMLLIKQTARLVLLDEPYGQLDADGSNLVDELVKEQKEQQRAVVVVSHLTERAAAAADHALKMRGGRMVWVGEASQVCSES